MWQTHVALNVYRLHSFFCIPQLPGSQRKETQLETLAVFLTAIGPMFDNKQWPRYATRLALPFRQSQDGMMLQLISEQRIFFASFAAARVQPAVQRAAQLQSQGTNS